MFFKHDDDGTLKHLNIKKIQTKSQGSFTTNRHKKKHNLLKILTIIPLIFLIYTLSQKDEKTNPLLGRWEPIIKTQNSINYKFDNNAMYINEKNPQKVKYEIYDNEVIVKPAIYGIITGIVPPSKFKIITKNEIEYEFAGIKTKYKKAV